jgi:hypothetical protein
MYKKLVSSILVVAFLNLLGCYTFQPVTVSEYKQVEEKEGKSHEIHVIMKYDQEYHFLDSNYTIENDTLYGTEILKTDYGNNQTRRQQVVRKIAVSEIKSIAVKSFDLTYTLVAFIGSSLLVYLLIVSIKELIHGKD